MVINRHTTTYISKHPYTILENRSDAVNRQRAYLLKFLPGDQASRQSSGDGCDDVVGAEEWEKGEVIMLQSMG